MAGRGYSGPELNRVKQESDEGVAAQQYSAPSAQEQIFELQARATALRRDHVLLLTQLARAVKCLNAVTSEEQLLKTEVASLQPGSGRV
ncbi:hypothetical protein TSOC_001325 [Tetrabaena socialis]|uniref:Uncharacterized protein n=1 Tax=Tetrabaena socialis TaxID=47790 RepID=A0A2J8AH27_9CHLO|nr:hypothetical protein TSOC_001325 [Tetrabaena socialis]|eukprot:PNH11817.1 hypothetical protein TSOC_001325 [Tetrabaena socialis]